MLGVTFTSPHDRDDQSLVEWHRSGHPDAFEEIVRRYSPGLLAAARRRLTDQQGAEDAVQETFVRAYPALDRFDGQYHLAGWLHQILRNVCLDEYERRQRQLRLLDRLGSTVEVESAAVAELPDSSTMVSGGDGVDVTDALQQLPAPYREALVMRFVEDRPYTEVAAAAGISEQNARARTSRARRMMRHALGGAAAFLGAVGGLARRGERAAAALTPDAVAASPAAAQLAPSIGHVAFTGGNAVAASVGVAASAVIAVMTLAPTTTPPKPAPPPVSVERAADAPRTTPTSVAAPDVAPTDIVASAVPEAVAPSTSTTVPLTSTTASTVPNAGPAPIGDVDAAPPPPAPTPVGAELAADDLTVTPAGSRRALSGQMTIRTDRGDEVATIEGKLLGGSAEGEVEGELVLRLADGRTLTLHLVGTTDADGTMTGRYRLDGADAIGVDREGTFGGTFTESDGVGALHLDLNGGLEQSQSPSS